MGDVELLSSVQIKSLLPAEEIIKLIECPICNEVPIGPIWLCVNGHNLCDSCRSQLNGCGLCRKSFSGGRNYFMEAIIQGSKLTCPYSGAGCEQILKGDEIKKHMAECDFGPKLKWVQCGQGEFPENAVKGGTQTGITLYVIRAPHYGSVTPGKLFEYCPPGSHNAISNASLSWGGNEHFKYSYEVLVAKKDYVKWIPSSNGELVPAAVRGGTSEDGEPLYIGRVQYHNDLVIGKIHPSHHVCYIGVEIERAFTNYEILVTNESPRIVSAPGGDDDMHAGFYS